MPYWETSHRTLKCENCSAELRISEKSLPDPEPYTLHCVWCGAFLEDGEAGSHPQVTLVAAGDASQQRSE